MQDKVIYQLTGTPFVDAGIIALCRLSGKKTPAELTMDDLVGSSEKIAEIFTSEKWGKALYSIFPNSILTNPSSKKYGDVRQKYLEFLRNLINDIKDDVATENLCISCGRYHVSKTRMRMDIPLLGSGEVLNFFPSAQTGADYCSACTFAVQFFPTTVRKGVDLYCVHSASISILRSWALEPIDELKRDLAVKTFKGPLSAVSNFPANALFEFSSSIIENLEENDYRSETSPGSVELIKFSNFQQGPNLRIYSLPTSFFRFLFDLGHDQNYLTDWKRIVSRNYKRKKDNEDIEYNKPNLLYQTLLANHSIVSFFIDKDRKENLCGWGLVEFYLREIEKMEKEKIGKIREIADNFGIYYIDGGHYKAFHNFENCKTYPEFRNQMRKVQKDWVLSKREGAPFSFDDYVEYLFPENILDWKEIRDLMLFRIYDKIGSTDWKEQILEIKVDEQMEED